MTIYLAISGIGLTTWVFFTWLTENAVIAGIWMAATLILVGLLTGVLRLVS